MSKKTGLVSKDDFGIQSRIKTIRGVQVLLDRDVAELYGVQTKALNQTVKRNLNRFPVRFMFQLTTDELENLRSQFVTSSWGGIRYCPYAFTEHGIMMLASMLKSNTAVQVSVRIVDAFVAMRKMLASLAPLLSRIETTERRQLKQEDAQARNEERFAMIFDAMSDKKFPPQKVFFDGEFFDAFAQIKRFVRQAKSSIIVIDPYFDDSCLPLIAQKRSGVMAMVVRSPKKAANGLHAADVAQFNKQYANSLTVKLTDKFHDRYLIIDNSVLLHVGASLNHLGKRCFAFSTLDPSFISDIMTRVPS